MSQVKERVQREDDAESVENLKKTLQEVELKGIAPVHKMNTYILYSYFTMDFFAAQEVQKKRAEVEKEIKKQPLNVDTLSKEGFSKVPIMLSVAEPPLFWAAPAPGGQGPGADSGSDLLGSAPAPAPGKKRRLRLRLHTLKFFILSS